MGARARHPARMAVSDHPRGDHAEALHLRGDGRDHRRAYDVDPRGARTRSATGTTAICWLRDAYFVISALNRLGATQTMEAYLNYITTIAVDVEPPLQPVYGIIHNQPLDERVAADLAGFRGMGPVRVGNQAVGADCSMTPTAASSSAPSHMFIDERLPRMGDEALYPPARAARPPGAAPLPRARRRTMGISRPQAHPYAFGDDVLGRLRSPRPHGRACWRSTNAPAYWRGHADKIRNEILERAWSTKRGALAGALDHDDLDASAAARCRISVSCRRPTTLSPHGRGHRQGAQPQRLHDALYRRRRLRRAGDRIPRLPVLVRRRASPRSARQEKARDLFTDVLSRANSFGILQRGHPSRTRASCGAISRRPIAWPVSLTPA